MVKIITLYWKNLFLESLRVMWKELGITGTLFGFLFSGIYVLVIREQTFSWDGILLFAKVSISLTVIAWLFYIVKVSATQDKNKVDKIRELDDELNSFTPNIQVSGVIDVRDVQIGHVANGMYVLSHITNIASVPFANNPKLPNRNNNAKNVRAEIDYLDENKTALLVSIQGRWGGLQPNEINSSDRTVLESTNFPNNNAKRWLDLVMKYPEDEYCYAYSNDSYGQGYFLHPNHIIERKRFFIHVSTTTTFHITTTC